MHRKLKGLVTMSSNISKYSKEMKERTSKCITGQNMFPHWKKSGMGEHKMAKNMFPTYTKLQNFEQSDRLHACRVYHVAFIKITLVIYKMYPIERTL